MRLRCIFVCTTIMVAFLLCSCHLNRYISNRGSDGGVQLGDDVARSKGGSDYSPVYRCQVVNLQTGAIYLAYDRKRNAAIKQARAACYAGADAAACNLHFDCQLQSPDS